MQATCDFCGTRGTEGHNVHWNEEGCCWYCDGCKEAAEQDIPDDVKHAVSAEEAVRFDQIRRQCGIPF